MNKRTRIIIRFISAITLFLVCLYRVVIEGPSLVPLVVGSGGFIGMFTGIYELRKERNNVE